MTDLITLDDLADATADAVLVLDEALAVPDADRPAFDGHDDDAYGWDA